MKETFCPKCGHACEPPTDELLDELERVAAQPGWQPVLDDQARARLRRVDTALSDLARGLQGAPAQSAANFSRAIGRIGTSTDLALRNLDKALGGGRSEELDWYAWDVQLAEVQCRKGAGVHAVLAFVGAALAPFLARRQPTLYGATEAASAAVTLAFALVLLWRDNVYVQAYAAAAVATFIGAYCAKLYHDLRNW